MDLDACAEPEPPLDQNRVRQNPREAGAEKAGQHADAAARFDDSPLGLQRGAGQPRLEAGPDLIQIAQLRRIDQVVDIADERTLQ